MNETTTTDSAHQTILRKISRLRGLAIASVALNGLILFLFILACVAHHHHKKHHHEGGGMDRHEMGMRGGGQGWGGRHEFRGGRFGGEREDSDRDQGGRGGFDRERGMGGPGEMNRGPEGEGKRMPATPEDMSNRMLDHLTRQLTLTDDEKAKIKPILLDQATQMQKDREAQKQAMEKAMTDTKAKIRALLTPDQQKQMDEAKMGPEAGKGPGEANAPVPPK